MKIVESHWSWLWWRKLSFFVYTALTRKLSPWDIFSLHKIKSKQRFFLTQSSLYYVLPSNDLQYKYWLQWLPQSDFNQFFKSNPNIIFARVFFILFFLISLLVTLHDFFLMRRRERGDEKKYKKFLASNKHIWRKFSFSLMTTFTSNWRQLWWQRRKKCLKHATNSIWNQRHNISRFTFLCMSVLQTCYTFSPHYTTYVENFSFILAEFEQQTFSTLMTKVFLFTTEIRYGIYAREWVRMEKVFHFYCYVACSIMYVCAMKN